MPRDGYSNQHAELIHTEPDTQLMSPKAVFKKSSLCTQGACVEVALLSDNLVTLRDSKSTNGPTLTFSSEEWRAFVGGVKNNEFDVPSA